MRLRIRLLEPKLAIVRLKPDQPPPAMTGEFFAFVRSAGELSVVMDQRRAPRKATKSTGWRLFQLEGPFDLTLTGVLASAAAPLADAGCSIFALATYDTDYFLIRGGQLQKAIRALRAAGHDVIDKTAAT